MSYTINIQILLGRVGQDPELRYTTKGDPVATFSLATSYGVGDDQTTTWHRCVAFKKTAEIVGEHVKKGALVFVRGDTRHEKYTDKQGVERWATKVFVHEIVICSRREQAETPPEHSTTAVSTGQPEQQSPVHEEDELPF